MSKKLQIASVFGGIYGVPEAAKFLTNTPPFINQEKVNLPRLRYWISTSVPYVAPSPYPIRQRLITFLDLISMRMVAIMRSRGVGLQEIRNHESWLREEFKIEYPFVSRDLWTLGTNVYMKFHDRLWASSKFGQAAMQFIEDWLTKIDLDMTFNEYDVASAWRPFNDICLNPMIQLGEPCIDGTRIPTNIIWSKHQAGDSRETIARSNNINVTQVDHAIEWEKRIVTTKV